jgi:Spy/CpxP family protein refolding chaperone
MKKIAILTLAVLFVMCASVSYAMDQGKGCPMMQGKGGGDMGIDDKFFMKSGFILDNETEIGLSDEQVAKVKDLTAKTQKMVIAKGAEIDTVAVDIKTALHQDTIDAAALKALVAKKYDLKKEKAMAAIDAYVGLKNILTKDQMDKMKQVWKEEKKQMKCRMAGMGGGMMKHGKK